MFLCTSNQRYLLLIWQQTSRYPTPPAMPHFSDLLATRISRRRLLGGGGALAAALAMPGLLTACATVQRLGLYRGLTPPALTLDKVTVPGRLHHANASALGKRRYCQTLPDFKSRCIGTVRPSRHCRLARITMVCIFSRSIYRRVETAQRKGCW